ncbi:MAG: NAD(P)H:quinone oxidoreductase [Candidatus Omnitrophica bacterium]|nr:NAD(P)H:quinone oxidoreductase [Candidatus Omnitrophota bacterium]MCM8816782.1 NAD(P)H:quinone oxidoreductase [Candidatus Omnitrophota bacterium]
MEKTKILVLYYSMYGNVFKMALEVCNGISQVENAQAILRKVPDLLPESVISKNKDIQRAIEWQKDVAEATLDDLRNCDGLLIGTPTRFGNMCSQMRNFLDKTGPLWLEGALKGKPAGIFTSSVSLHGGQESTCLATMLTLLHHGMIIVGIPSSTPELMKTSTGGTPYGASHVVGLNENFKELSEEEKQLCRFLGKRVAEIALKLK